MTWKANAVALETPWLVDKFWLQHGINLVLGPEKTGKSRFIGWLLARMLALPNGAPVLYDSNGEVFSAHQGFRKILYLNAEEQAEDVMARVNAYARHLGWEPRDDWPIHCVPAAGMQLQKASEREEFEKAFLVKQEYDVIILDPLRRVHAANENSNSDMAPLHNDIRRWSQSYKQSWTIVHHSPKFREDDDLERIATWCRGNTDLAGLADGATMIRSLGGTQTQQLRAVKRMGRFAPQEDVVLLDSGDPKGFVVRL